MKNNSYVCVPTDKLIELITDYCPPVHNSACPGRYEYGTGKECVKCWCAWLKDGEQS